MEAIHERLKIAREFDQWQVCSADTISIFLLLTCHYLSPENIIFLFHVLHIIKRTPYNLKRVNTEGADQTVQMHRVGCALSVVGIQ